LIEHEILNWDQHMDLIAKVILEQSATLGQAGTILISHKLLLQTVVASTKMMPQTQANSVGVLIRLNTDAPAVLRNVLYGRMPIRMTH